jgi:hypothetical protein
MIKDSRIEFPKIEESAAEKVFNDEVIKQMEEDTYKPLTLK